MGRMRNIPMVFSQSGVWERVGEGAAVLGTKASLCRTWPSPKLSDGLESVFAADLEYVCWITAEKDHQKALQAKSAHGQRNSINSEPEPSVVMANLGL